MSVFKNAAHTHCDYFGSLPFSKTFMKSISVTFVENLI